MHNWIARIGLMIGVLLAGMMPAAAAAQTTEPSNAEAFLVTPLSFVKQDDLIFGSIIPSNTNGTVVMDSTGAVTTTNGIVHIDGTQQPARFWGFGAFLQIVIINVDANSHTLTHTNGTDSMVMDQVLIGSQPPIVINTNPRRFRIVNPAGFFSFTIAGRLQVGADQEPGVYEGQFTLTLEYQ